MNVSAQDHSLHAGELQHCIFHSPALRPFLLIQGFPRYIDEAPKGRVSRGKPSPSRGPCPAPRRGHTSISPRNTRLAALPSKCMWVLRHGLISITARSCLSALPPTPGFPHVHLPREMAARGDPRSLPLACGELGASAWQELVLPGLLGRKAAGAQALAVSKTFQRSDPEPLNYSLALTKYREPGSSSHL